MNALCRKIGKTKELPERRLFNYSSMNPGRPGYAHLIVCKNVDDFEDHVKIPIGPFLSKGAEWVQMQKLNCFDLIYSTPFLVPDAKWSEEFGISVYNFADHDCVAQKCLPNGPFTNSSEAYRRHISSVEAKAALRLALRRQDQVYIAPKEQKNGLSLTALLHYSNFAVNEFNRCQSINRINHKRGFWRRRNAFFYSIPWRRRLLLEWIFYGWSAFIGSDGVFCSNRSDSGSTRITSIFGGNRWAEEKH